ncbi:MAG TPA: type IV pilus modification protein PilV [Rhodocyclaceae bacterium]|nr:type IV pilus modification protein PilV [Rhodocyclaceae bacterium]
MKRPSAASGFVLLEALIGILIFSLGILGIVGFQAAATKLTSESRYRTEAALYADELIADMRVSNSATLTTDYDSNSTTDAFGAWRINRLQAAAKGLPGGNATLIDPATGLGNAAPIFDATTQTYLVDLSVTWQAPGETTPGSYNTVVTIDPN